MNPDTSGFFQAISHIINTQGDMGYIALLLVSIASIYGLKLLRDDLKECATNYIEDSKRATAAFTEFTVILREMKDKL